MRAPIGWLQLTHKPLRLLVALSGIAFAVLLIMMQLGFRSALFESAVRFHERFDYDIALFSPDSVFIVRPQPFSIRRLYQALGFDAVEDVTPVYIFPSVWKNPWNNERRSINTIGFHPDDPLLAIEGFDEARELLRNQDVVLFDRASRPEFGPVADELAAGRTVVTIRLKPGKDADRVRDAMAEYLPDDVLVLTKQQFVQREKDYWNSATPIGYIFAFGAIMGFVVGAIIVYQILFADVSEHLNEYATLRAIGYRNRFVSGIVLQEAAILAVLGYVPGVAIVYWLYGKAATATNLPLYITQERATTVFLMTLTMCALSGLMAVRKVRRLDPADVF
jgi:putative ABC transport system permease protein